MDAPSTPDAGQIAVNAAPLMQSAVTGTIALGTTISVPDGMGVMLLFGTEALDLLGPGQHVIDGAAAPLLAQRLQYSAGALAHAVPQATALMLPNPGPVTIAWKAAGRINTYQTGLVGCKISCRAALRITDPRRLYAALLAGWPFMLSQMPPDEAALLREAPIGQAAQIWVTRSLAQIVTTALPSVSFTTPERLDPSAKVSAAAGQTATQWLWGAGLELVSLAVDPIEELGFVSCDSCGASDRPAQFGTYRRTISVLVMRFMKEKKGHFCTPCAAKISAEYNLVMLVCGWWGYIGIIMTPVFLINNCYQFCKAAISNKKQATAFMSPTS
jgi:hypothetical protein